MASDGIDKLAKTLVEELPQSLKSMRDDLEKNFRSILQSGLGKLDLVTREEFEVQQAVLRRTREKLEALDAHLQEMEAGLGAKKARQKKAAKKTGKRKAKKKTPGKKSAKKKSKR